MAVPSSRNCMVCRTAYHEITSGTKAVGGASFWFYHPGMIWLGFSRLPRL